MALLLFDTFDFVEKLTSSGMAKEQARALVEGLQKVNLQGAATKEDIALVLERLDGLRSNTEKLEKDMLRMKSSLLQWFTGIILAQAALVATLVKLL